MTVIGCSGSLYDPELRLPCSSYLIQYQQTAILLDCGFGSFESYAALAPNTPLDAIVVSHAHADHVADLPLFMDSAESWRRRPRLIASEATMAQIVHEPHSLPMGTQRLARSGCPMTLTNFELMFSSTTHKIPTLACCVLRVSWRAANRLLRRHGSLVVSAHRVRGR